MRAVAVFMAYRSGYHSAFAMLKQKIHRRLLSMKRVIRFFIFCAVLALDFSYAAAQTMPPDTPADTSANAPSLPEITVKAAALPDQNRNQKPDWLEKYLPHERRIAGWVDNTARGIDRFFGTDDAWRVDNDSYLRVINDLRWGDGEGVTNEFRPRLRLDLPTASKRLRLLIESDSAEERTAAEQAVPGLQTSEDRRRTTVFGVGTNFEGWFPEWKKQFQSGVRARLPLDPYARFVARRDIPLGGKWELNSYNRFAWFNSDGYSAKSAITIGKPTAPDWRLYYSTNLAWREERDYLEFAQSANLANVLSSHSAITYTAGFSGMSFSRPEVHNYFLTANYRHNVARRLVYFDVIPELGFADENDFDPRFALTFRIELYFQKQIEADD